MVNGFETRNETQKKPTRDTTNRSHQDKSTIPRQQRHLYEDPCQTRSKKYQFALWEKNQTTLQKFDSLSHQLRRSKTGTLDVLITHYEWFQNNRSEVIK